MDFFPENALGDGPINSRIRVKVIIRFKADPAERLAAGEIYDWNWVQDSNQENPKTALEMMREMAREGGDEDSDDEE